MKHNSFPLEKLKKLHHELRTYCQNRPQEELVAAFDADGTLWNTDLGEALFDYQVRHQLLPHLPEDPWQHYEDLKAKVSHEVAYLWLAQINAGLPLTRIQSWAKAAVDQLHPVPIFPEMKQTIDLLHDLGCKVFVVTASIKWAVEPGAQLLNLPAERVIGIRTKIKDGVITHEQEGVITYKQGKVEGLLEATGGQAPFFCAGNTEGDLPLLESATHFRLVVAGSPSHNSNYPTERNMLSLAQQRQWFWHSYLSGKE